MLQEYVDDKTVALSVKALKITGNLLAKAMRDFLKKAREPTYKHGKQSVRSLTKQGASLSNIEITGENIGSFKKVARKYNVDFALKKDSSETPPKWMVFFKGKDADSLTAAFKEFSSVQLKHKKSKPSVLAALEKAKEIISAIAPPVKKRHKGEHEL
jgi:hypothetical protein